MEDLVESCPADGPPIFRISITPLFDHQGASSLSIQQTLARPRCIAHEALLLFETRYGNVPAYQFAEENVLAFDNDGPLPIYFTKTRFDSPDQEWRVKRSTSGKVTLYFKVFPRCVDIKTPMGPRVHMRRDQGGLISGGRWFLPRPAADRVWRHVVEWDLSEAPLDTRAMWSYGEGPGPISRDGYPMTVANSVFMVGPIKSYPKPASTKQPLSGANINCFSLMDPEDDGYDNGWYVEGLAEFYSIFLPYRFGLRGFDYLVGRLNGTLQAYGRSPRIHMDIVDSQRSFYDDWYAELIPYMRGCVYLLQIDSCLRKASGIFGFDQMSPLDDIIVDMGKRWQRGEKLQSCDWLAYLWPYLGDMSQGFREMLRGTAMDLKDVLVAHEDWILATSMQEILEFGLDKSSINQRIVSGLVQGSRAAIAGLKNGDKILLTSRASFSFQGQARVALLVKRKEVDANSMDKNGRTHFSRATARGHEEVVELFLERNNVKADIKDDYGRTALAYAAFQGEAGVVALLVKRNDIDVDSTDNNGRKCLSWAAANRHGKIVRLISEEKPSFRR
ncbi:hypothetical protein N7533_006413 [Penicillium manginii]|uniref:uncharacterized protein n=1 Tax=Penicillium manginii TaxID=203109 RepID=UPI00254942F2|nr:uncharacterized protein N7533_006413 [Penicillium manginii]KAJ5756870.1 hypothetical protein N7533_006413 [Penicillium manginii]